MDQTLAVEPSQLLGRTENLAYGLEAYAMIESKVVLVTGAGGSIGSEIVRQVLSLKPKKVYYVDNDEFALYTLQMQLEGVAMLDSDRYRLADICDYALMQRIMTEVQPDIVFHAAAKKHLPLLERSPEAAVKTNVFGTESVVKAATESGVSYVVNVSTDKAANPSSALGWSKRLAEHVAASYSNAHTKVVSVRFGNVLGSRGSFLPTLIHQMERGETISITDPEVSRFFMTIPEAASLVIEAACLADGGKTYVLDMGVSVKIEDLVRRYAKLSGKAQPRIRYIGLRPGEKLQEELFDPSESHQQTTHPRIWMANVGAHTVSHSLVELRKLIEHGAHPDVVRNELEFYIPREEKNEPHAVTRRRAITSATTVSIG